MSINDEYYTADTDSASAADRKLPVKFWVDAKLDPVKSEAAGRDIFREVEMITILIPGDKLLNYTGRVLPVHKQRFATQYAAWRNAQAGKEAAMEGTPLAGWPGLTEGQRKELAYFNIFTVEQLAELSDGYASNMMGIQQFKQAAKRFVEAAKSAAPMLKVQNELAQRDATIEGLKMQLGQQSDQIAAILARMPAPTP